MIVDLVFRVLPESERRLRRLQPPEVFGCETQRGWEYLEEFPPLFDRQRADSLHEIGNIGAHISDYLSTDLRGQGDGFYCSLRRPPRQSQQNRGEIRRKSEFAALPACGPRSRPFLSPWLLEASRSVCPCTDSEPAQLDLATTGMTENRFMSATAERAFRRESGGKFTGSSPRPNA